MVRTEVDDPYKVLTATPRLLASVLAVVLLTFFFMVYGENLQRQAIALLPRRQQKKSPWTSCIRSNARSRATC